MINEWLVLRYVQCSCSSCGCSFEASSYVDFNCMYDVHLSLINQMYLYYQLSYQHLELGKRKVVILHVFPNRCASVSFLLIFSLNCMQQQLVVKHEFFADHITTSQTINFQKKKKLDSKMVVLVYDMVVSFEFLQLMLASNLYAFSLYQLVVVLGQNKISTSFRLLIKISFFFTFSGQNQTLGSFYEYKE